MLFVTLVPCLILLALTFRISLAIRHSIIRRKSLCPPPKEILINGDSISLRNKTGELGTK